jgi:hypothetical protein
VRPVPDIYDRPKRSEIMAGVPAKGTKPELVVRKVAHRLGYRFRLHRDDLNRPGLPGRFTPANSKMPDGSSYQMTTTWSSLWDTHEL